MPGILRLKLYFSDDGVINVRQGYEVRLNIYGIGLTNESEVKLTSSVASAGHACKSQGLHVQVDFLRIPCLLSLLCLKLHG